MVFVLLVFPVISDADTNQQTTTANSTTETQQTEPQTEQETASFFGIVKDADTNEEIIGATIQSTTNSTIGIITDFDGKFNFDFPKNGQVQVSYVGYEPVEITLKENEDNVISLKTENELQEVPVDACDTQISKWDNQTKTCLCNDTNKVWNKEKRVCEDKQTDNKDDDDETEEETENETEEENELKKKKQEYEDAKAREQSLANRTLTATAIAATGIGTMELLHITAIKKNLLNQIKRSPY